MVLAFQKSESIGLVSSYWVTGNELGGAGFPIQTPMLSGKECVRWYFRNGMGVTPFGSQTQVMYRSCLVRGQEAFYNISFPLLTTKNLLKSLSTVILGLFIRCFRSRGKIMIRSFIRFFYQWRLTPWLNTFSRRLWPLFLGVNESASVIAKYRLQYYRALAGGAYTPGRAFGDFIKQD